MKNLLLAFMLANVTCQAVGQSSSNANSAIDALLRVLAPMSQLQGKFQQYQYGSQGELLAESSGNFRLLRPGYFSWEITQPDRQLIVAGPEYLWHYDKDLETASRRPVTTGEEWTPLQVLGGDEVALRSNFAVVKTAPERFQLTPLTPRMGFQSLDLTLEAGALKKMIIEDTLSQSVVIDFYSVESDAVLSGDDFSFSPPAETDLFYHDK